MEDTVISTDEAHCRGHIVQFYKDERFLIGAINEFVKQGLSRGEAVVVLCTQAHWKLLKAELERTCPQASQAINDQQLQYSDAYIALGRVLDDEGRPDASRFYSLIGGIHAALSPRFPKMRFYGELVDILCENGRGIDADVLEQYWNGFLAAHLECSLLCGYCTDNISSEEGFERVRLTHSDVITPEDISVLRDEDELYRRIALLEMTIASQGLEREDLTRDLQLSKSHLLQMGKLSILGELCAGLAHELNNPLAVISGGLEQLRETLPPSLIDERLEKKLHRMEAAAGRMSKIVQNVLRFARQEPFKKEFVSLQDAITTAIDLSQDSLETHNIDITFRNPAEQLCLEGDSTAISQAFANLISNARDAIVLAGCENGCIEIDVRRSSGGKIEIVVSDNGVGMDEKTLRKIFMPFFTTKEIGKGTGLGLSLAQASVKDHGGHISCSSIKGHGTVFRIIFPCADQERPASLEREHSAMA